MQINKVLDMMGYVPLGGTSFSESLFTIQEIGCPIVIFIMHCQAYVWFPADLCLLLLAPVQMIGQYTWCTMKNLASPLAKMLQNERGSQSPTLSPSV